PGVIVAPGVFDMVSLRLADACGFDALYMTGFGTVASHLGLPDAGLATYTDMLNRVSAMAKMARTPLIADADTGYGGLLNLRHTVRGYEAAGAAAIQLEDQEFPKKCGHTPGRRVIETNAMVDKIRVAVDSRESKDFLIIARTDARSALGLDEALRRADAYAHAGADLLFIESPESVDEMRRIGESFDLPLVANMVEKGRTPVLTKAELESLGYKVAIFPVAAPVGKIGDAILILVANPSLPAKNLRDVLALSKTQSGGLFYGTSGTGGTPHIAGELLKQRTGANLTHVPYKGGGQAIIDVLGGNIPLVYTAVAGAHQHVKSGKLIGIAVSSVARASSLPDVPTFIEGGVPDFEINSWVGIFAPAKTPKPVLDKLNAELDAVLNDAEVRERLNTLGINATPGSAESSMRK
ncbi:MAG: tripartite tricarboxylate transporter substrate-binding protein, partial [Burkholderiaceae bacterium]